jgi:hypothetical protein
MIPVITRRRGQLKALDDYFAGMLVRAIGIELRKFLNERSAAGVAGPAIDRNLRLFAADVQTRSTAGKDLRRSVFPDAGRIRTTGALSSDRTSNAFFERV